MILISVVVPAYNSEQYIKECICSIMNQSFKEFEIIVIDDGSTDNTNAIACSLLSCDTNISVYTIANAGSNNAREYGVKKSKGEYICFVDSDDTLPLDSLQILYDNAISSKSDIVVGNYNVVRNHKVVKAKGRTDQISSIDFLKSILLRNVSIGPWGKLYKRDLFTNDTFLMPFRMPRGEDAIMNIRLGMRASRIGLIELPIYNYIYRSGSITNTFITTYDYELSYDNQIISSIKQEYHSLLKEEIIHFRLGILKTMILSRIVIPMHSAWIHDLLSNSRICRHLTLKERLILCSLHYPPIAGFCRALYQLKQNR